MGLGPLWPVSLHPLHLDQPQPHTLVCWWIHTLLLCVTHLQACQGGGDRSVSLVCAQETSAMKINLGLTPLDLLHLKKHLSGQTQDLHPCSKASGAAER